MQRENLLALLKEAADSHADESFSFADKQQATVYIAAGADLLTIDRVTEVVLRGGVAIVQTAKERFYADAERVVAVRLHAGTDATGFIG